MRAAGPSVEPHMRCLLGLWWHTERRHADPSAPRPTSREVLAGAPPAPRARAQEIVGLIVREQSPKALLEVRGKLYELLVNCIPPELVLRRMALELLPKLDDELKHKVVEHAAFFEHRLQARLASATLPAHASPPLAPAPRAEWFAIWSLYVWSQDEVHCWSRRSAPAALLKPCSVLCCSWLRYRVRLHTGGPEGDIPSGGLCGKVHERLQDLDHPFNGLSSQGGLWALSQGPRSAHQPRARGLCTTLGDACCEGSAPHSAMPAGQLIFGFPLKLRHRMQATVFSRSM